MIKTKGNMPVTAVLSAPINKVSYIFDTLENATCDKHLFPTQFSTLPTA